MDMRRSLVPDIVTLQAFECAARHANFSRAAEELNLTQSAVSRQIADLEAQTGLKLFERIRQRVVLSDAGRQFLPDVKDLLSRSERLMIDAAAVGRTRARLKIATLPTFGARWLVPRLGDFLSAHPDVAITVESRSRPFSFMEDSFDLAIHYGQPVWAGGTPTFLCSEKVMPIASPRLVRDVAIDDVEAMTDLPLLHLTTRPKLWSQWFELTGQGVENAYHGARFDQFSMMIAAAVAGLGAALLPTYLIEDELSSSALKPLTSKTMTTENAYYIVRPEEKQSLPTVEQFQSWLLSQVSGGFAE
ncbi:LysR family transcriptional regulator [Rhizobium lusitanum]|uniref:LysR family transcriptional regulator n=1 Tax=Rhizobium lusitanum TaxID=293958 RepID=UPI001958B3E4|nr:LysR family transcriptional regulator [Rhizobium lusitanum]MBM7046199.1 LysR family transcriptional regulator [Rhizobium lusitanum]